jgi:hypothetical protein
MCGNWNYKSSELAKRLSKDTIRKGGIQQINAPVINCHVASDLELMTVEMGGDPILVHYNKDREKQHKIDKQHKRERSLKRQIKRFGGRSTGLDLPSPDLYLDSSRGNTK